MDKTNHSKKKNQAPQRPNQINEYVKYSGLAFQQAGLILLGYWLGSKIDSWLDLSFPAFTIILILLFMALSFYSLIKSLPKE